MGTECQLASKPFLDLKKSKSPRKITVSSKTSVFEPQSPSHLHDTIQRQKAIRSTQGATSHDSLTRNHSKNTKEKSGDQQLIIPPDAQAETPPQDSAASTVICDDHSKLPPSDPIQKHTKSQSNGCVDKNLDKPANFQTIDHSRWALETGFSADDILISFFNDKR